MTTRFLKGWMLALLALTLIAGVALAQNVYTPIDPCNLNMRSAVTVPVAAATSTSAQIIAAPSSGRIWICDYNLQPASSSTVQLEYGTGTVCATGTTNLTGALAGSSAQNDAGVPPAQVPATKALCAAFTGTGAQGFVTYVVAP